MNSVCKLLHIDYPIFQGGMGNISNSELAVAVSEAGGLGTIGCGTMTPGEVEKIISDTVARTDKPFAVNIALGVTPYVDQLIDLVIKYNVQAISLSAGDPAAYIPILHKHNIKVIAVVASVKHAKKAEAAGADLLVAEGFEAAGINSNLELTTFTLIPQIVKHVTIPVLAAGGIGDGKGFAAALMLGAEGVQIGTRFIATKEAPFHDEYKKRLIEAEDTSTVIIGRRFGRIRRILKNPYASRLVDLEKKEMTLEQYGNLTSEGQHVLGALKGDMENGFINSGQVAGLINHIPSVKELLEGIIREAQEQIIDSANKIASLSVKSST
ncbi:NAD(P)H-dependent flavin oxidoreductase [Virgibacillus sp. DJP39]|uniref:NAD(P)H-dependent flavin oxidoreductase n=1 Tax=Virgibacillus sp. DJP39 TaxID=3409790 RepID=UPI003BB5F9AB